MKYTEIKIMFLSNISEDDKGICIAELGDLGCDSFAEEGRQLSAYIENDLYATNKEAIGEYLKTLPKNRTDIKEMEDKNWNEVWESNFEPIIINANTAVRAPFHEAMGYENEFIIMPRMAFGTGHHQTTQLMIEGIFASDMEGKKVLDMGCGSGVLAIAALKKGAVSADAIDIDEWAYDNVMENATHNGVQSKIRAFWGDASIIDGGGVCENEEYDFIFANINRNILLRDMEIYLRRLRSRGEILFSGFLETDIDMMCEHATGLGLKLKYSGSRDKWYMLQFSKL